jgi:hypothetical protein
MLGLAIADFIFFHFNVDETKGQAMPSQMPKKGKIFLLDF